jgi:GMP synthase-like glutamine amidotransferase
MKPIAIIQHSRTGEPGTISSILETADRDAVLVRVFDGDDIPKDASVFSGIVLLGGSMGVHDRLPWIPAQLGLIRDADRHDVPIVGHCLGAQLIALALGSDVRKHARPEIGWGTIMVGDSNVAREWWGEYAGKSVRTFQWHSDTFDPPPDSIQIANGTFCRNQVVVTRGRHLLVQSHLELTAELVRLWATLARKEIIAQNALKNPAVTKFEDLLVDLEERTQAMRPILARLYSRWLTNCV